MFEKSATSGKDFGHTSDFRAAELTSRLRYAIIRFARVMFDLQIIVSVSSMNGVITI